jgi:SAM-dependent methyltransferase
MERYDPKSAWQKPLTSRAPTGSFPAQGLIRILRGDYPSLPPIPTSGKAIDIGCGIGRNTVFLADSGYRTTGFEISESITESLNSAGTAASFEVGYAHELPLPDESVDLAVAWHSFYYMGLHDEPLAAHFKEVARVLRPGGAFICAMPMLSCFIFEDSVADADRADSSAGVMYRRIRKDPFNIRVGEVLATFESSEAVERVARDQFHGQVEIGTETGDWFGLGYDWWDLVAIK